VTDGRPRQDPVAPLEAARPGGPLRVHVLGLYDFAITTDYAPADDPPAGRDDTSTETL